MCEANSVTDLNQQAASAEKQPMRAPELELTCTVCASDALNLAIARQSADDFVKAAGKRTWQI